QLLRQKGNAVPTSFGVQCVWRVIQFKALGFAHDLLELTCNIRSQERLLRRVLQKNSRRRSVRNKLPLIEINVTRHVGVERLRSHLLAEFLEAASLANHLVRDGSRHQNKYFESVVHTAQRRANRSIVTVTDESESFRVDIFATQ